jgi:hypothetical protein
VLRVLAILTALALTLAACGGDDDDDAPEPTTSAASGTCAPIEEVEIGQFGHVAEELTASDYATNPPTWGNHNDTALTAGQFYTQGAPYGHSVHLLEHGAVIGWTNNLSSEDFELVESAFNEAFKEGYYQLAVVENPDLDVPFALSAWGAMQKCDGVDASVIKPFIEQWYASPKSAESSLACQDSARRLPPC